MSFDKEFFQYSDETIVRYSEVACTVRMALGSQYQIILKSGESVYMEYYEYLHFIKKLKESYEILCSN